MYVAVSTEHRLVTGGQTAATFTSKQHYQPRHISH